MNITEGRAWAEISLDHLANNYRIVKRKAAKAEIMAAIKADAYGHGAVEVARTLESEGVKFFGVASVEEGIELRQAGIMSRILVLSPILKQQTDAAIEYNLNLSISDLDFFKHLAKRLHRVKRTLPIHIEVDTGMTRTGFSYDRAISLIKKIHSSKAVKIEGIFSHFPMADTDGSFTKEQIKQLHALIKELRKLKINPPYVHLANSSGLFKHPDARFKLVRPGIALYGLSAAPSLIYSKGLKPVMSLKSRVVNIRQVKPNTPVSYGHTFFTKRRSRIATVSVGYGDGYPRALSNIGEVLLKGRRARIVGTICMDLIMVDVTAIKGVKIGDLVTLIGKDGKEEITAEECARKTGTIVYEITSGIGPRVARVFTYQDRFISIRNLLGRWRYDQV